MFESFEAFFIHVFWSRWRDNVPICQKQWVSFKLQVRNHKYVDAWELLALFFFFHFFFSCHPLVRSQALRPSLSESNQKNCWPAIWRAKLFTLKILIAFLCLTPLSFWKKVLSYQIYQWATEIYQWATRIWIKSFALCIWMYKDIYVSFETFSEYTPMISLEIRAIWAVRFLILHFFHQSPCYYCLKRTGDNY